jgi:hypothetical protein
VKIGILTYQRAHNYGALLQVYATQTYLRELGHKVVVIDYWPDYHAQEYKLLPYFNTRSFKAKIKYILLLWIGYSRILKRSRQYKKFEKEQLNLSDKPQYLHKEALYGVKYDVVIYGSDQIWRKQDYPIFKGFDEVYFGSSSLTARKKIAYAASMGVINLKNEDLAFLGKMVGNFDAISVREEELKKVLESVTDRKVSLVLDPVFLLDKEKWVTLIPERRGKKEKYILLYQLVPSEESIKLANLLQGYYGYEVIEIRGRVNSLLFGKRYMQTESPFKFLSLIKNAEIVVSTSFHGAAFSLIFEKQFYAVGMGNNSGRIMSLLSSLEIGNRYLLNLEDANIKEVIDYNRVNKKLKENRENSIVFLKNALYGEGL